jgi:misacylated tRNA(Ala) deacylase
VSGLLFRDDAYLRVATATVAAVSERGVELDRTIFYSLGGGQPGDTGWLVRGNGERFAVVDTRKGERLDSVLHLLAAGSPSVEPGEAVALELDWERRHALMRLHTALHVMSCVVVAPVTGGNIAPDKARLDFDIDMALLDPAKIERETNALIAHRPAALRRHPRAQHRRDRRHPRAAHPQRGQAQHARRDRAGVVMRRGFAAWP